MIAAILNSINLLEGNQSKELSFDKTSDNSEWVENLKRFGRWIQKVRLWRTLKEVIRSIGCVIFVAPIENQQIEEARVKAMQFRGIL